MSSVDQRIVQMEFNNRQFENGVQTSLKSLEKLKEGLNLSGSAKHLSELQTAGSKFNLDTMGRAIESISNRFSTMGVVGMAAIANLTNRAINMGEKMLKSLSVDQISSGWSKYGQKVASVQTIMNSTGLSINDVNGYLDKLMWFSDETSYSFTDMTAALGQMTSTGGDIKKLIPLITGVANATAFAGKGAAEFSRVMYNLNQSYSGGFLNLMDFKSLQLAGVASKELKQTFIDTGVALGKIKKGEVTIANFADSLQKKWADTTVMEKAFGLFGEMSEKAYAMVEAGEVDTAAEAYEILSKTYTGIGITAAKAAQEAKTFEEAIAATKDAVSSGWMKSFDIIFGDYEEAKILWTGLTQTLWEVFASGAEARNELLQGWKKLGGRTVLIEAISDAYNNLSEALAPIGEAFREIFAPMTAQSLFDITQSLKTFVGYLKIGEVQSENLKRTFKGVFALLDIGVMGFKALAKGIANTIKFFLPVGSSILEFTGGLGDFIVKVRDALKASDSFNVAVKNIGIVLAPIANLLKYIGNAFTNVFSNMDMSVLDEFGNKVETRFAPFVFIGQMLAKTFQFLGAILDKLSPVIQFFANIINTAFNGLKTAISEAVNEMKFDSLFDLVNGGIIAFVLLSIRKFMEGLTEVAKSTSGIIDSFKGIFSGIKAVLDEVKESLKSYQDQLKAKTLMTIALAIGILAAAIIALSLIDSAKLTKALIAMSVLFAQLFGSMMIFEKQMGNSKFAGITKVTIAMVALSIAILLLAFALKVMSDLDMESITRGLIAITALAAIMVQSAKALSSSGKKLIKGAFGLIIFAGAIYILASAVRKLGELDADTLRKGLISIAALSLTLVGFIKLLGDSKMSISTSIGLLVLAAAINLLYLAVKNFGELSVEHLRKGLGAMGIVLLQLAIFTKIAGGSKKMISIGIGLAIISGAMLVFAMAMKTFGSMNITEIGKGLLAMGGALLIIAIAMRLMPKNLLVSSLGLAIVALSLLAIVDVLSILSRMKPENILKSLVALAGALTVIVIAANFMTKALPGAAAMLIMSHALLVMAGVFAILGAMSIGAVITGLIALAGVFAVIAIASNLIYPILPALFGLAAAMALIGVAVLAFGFGVSALAVGMTALATAAVLGLTAWEEVRRLIGAIIVDSLAAIGKGIIGFAEELIKGAGVIANAVGAIAIAIIDKIIEVTPKIVGFVINFLVETLDALSKAVPKMVESGMALIVGILEGIGAHMYDLVVAGMEIISQFMLGIANKLPDIIDSAFKVIISFINGLAEAIRNNYEAIYDAVGNLISSIVEAIFGLLWKLIESGGDIISNIIDGAVDMISSLWNDMVEIGEDIINGIIEGVKNMGKALWKAAEDVVSGAVDGILDFFDMSSPSKLMMGIGENVDLGLIKGIDSMADDVATSGTSIGVAAVDSVRNAISKIGNVLSGSSDFDPVITPVIDMTNIDAGIKSMDEQFRQDRTISLAGAERRAISAVGSVQTETSTNGEATTSQQSVSYVFNQNNYSPKALTRLDIYRQTKNQFSAMKGVVVGT